MQAPLPLLVENLCSLPPAPHPSQVLLVENLSTKIAEMGHAREEVSILRYSPDGTKLAAGSHDNFVYFYSVLSGYQVTGSSLQPPPVTQRSRPCDSALEAMWLSARGHVTQRSRPCDSALEAM